MMREVTEQELFEKLPVHKAVVTLAIPTIISQIFVLFPSQLRWDRSQYEESLVFIRGCAKGAMVDNGIFSKDNSVITNYINQNVLK